MHLLGVRGISKFNVPVFLSFIGRVHFGVFSRSRYDDMYVSGLIALDGQRGKAVLLGMHDP